MKHYLILLLFVLTSACSIQRFKLKEAPLLTSTTSWLSHQEFAATDMDSDISYRTSVVQSEAEHYELAVNAEDQSGSYRITVRRKDLAITGFKSGEVTLELYLPLLNFPLHRGKIWQDTLLVQDHPRRAVERIPVKFEVKEVMAHDYIAGQDLASEGKAFFILAHLPNQLLSYHYVAATKDFPGTNPVDLYFSLDFLNANVDASQIQISEYQR